MTIRRLIFATACILWVAAMLILFLYPKDPPRREASVSGIVLSPSGSPMPGAEIYLVHNEWEDPSELIPPGPQARSDATGKFKVDGILFGLFYLVATHPDHCQSEAVEVRIARGGSNDIRIQLTEGGRLSGTVHPSQGRVSGRQIELYSHRGLIGWRSTRSDGQGRFSLDMVIAQDYIIELSPEGSPDPEADRKGKSIRMPITVRKGRTTNVVLGGD
jgi:hypothetical protein